MFEVFLQIEARKSGWGKSAILAEVQSMNFTFVNSAVRCSLWIIVLTKRIKIDSQSALFRATFLKSLGIFISNYEINFFSLKIEQKQKKHKGEIPMSKIYMLIWLFFQGSFFFFMFFYGQILGRRMQKCIQGISIRIETNIILGYM